MGREGKIFAAFVIAFLAAYFVPLAAPSEDASLMESALLQAFSLLQWYAQKHTLACVVPAMFIAGAITTFFSKEAVLRHLGPKANKVEAYSVASVSGTVLAVCSCSVLPMFAGIYRVGAGLGPASAFLYAGPAINVLALVLTASVLGVEIGIARAIGAMVFGVVIGILMAVIFRRDEQARTAATMQMPDPPASRRSFWQTAAFFVAMIAFLVFSDWFNPGDKIVELNDGTKLAAMERKVDGTTMQIQLKEPYEGHDVDDVITLQRSTIADVEDVDNWVVRIHHIRWYLAAAMGVAVLLMTWRWFVRDEINEWTSNTWIFAKQLFPLLFGGVFVAGFLGALLPDDKVAALVGQDLVDEGFFGSLRANFTASVIGCFFYFATLTEIPFLQALTSKGMAQGPALALLLAGPAMSIPSILVIRSIMGNKKTLVFTALVVVMATITGMIYGAFF